MSWSLLLLIVSLILAALAMLNVPSHPRFSLFPAAFFFYVLSIAVGSGALPS